MPESHHKTVSKPFGSIVDIKLSTMSLLDDMTHMDMIIYLRSSYGKEHAKARWSYKHCPDKLDWPPVVMECRVSQTQYSLHNAARWWISNSR